MRLVACAAVVAGVVTGVSGAPMAARASPGRLPVAVFNSAQGLPGDNAEDVLIDSRSYVWVTTAWGVSRFDGTSFANYGEDAGIRLPADGFAETADGTIWVAADNGLLRYRPEVRPVFTRVAASSGEAPERAISVCALAGRTDNALAVATRTDVYRVEPTSDRARFVPLFHDAASSVFVVACDPSGSVWVGGRDGTVRRIDGAGAAATWDVDVAAKRPWVRDILVDDRRRLWVATSDGLCAGEAGAAPGSDLCQGRILVRRAGKGPFLNHIAQARDGSVWVVTSDELWRLAPDVRVERPAIAERFGSARGLPAGGTLTSVAHDEHGDAWITSWGSGLVRLAPDGAVSWAGEDGVHGDTRDLWFDRRGVPHAVTLTSVSGVPERSLQVFENGRWASEAFPHPRGEPDSGWGWHELVATTDDGTEWFGSGHGLLAVDRRGRMRRVAALPRGEAFRVWAGRGGKLWISLSGGNDPGFVYDPHRDRAEPLSIRGVPAGGRCWSMAFADDARGRVWLACASGAVGRPIGATDYEYLTLPVSRREMAYDLAFDARGRLWVATENALFMTETPDAPTPTWRRITPEDEPVRSGSAVLVDGEGRVLFGSFRGIDVFDGDGRAVRRLTTAAGLPNNIVKELALAPDGRVWAGTAAGICRLPDLSADAADAPPPPFIAGVRTAQREVAVSDVGVAELSGLRLQPDESALDVSLRAVALRPDAGVRFVTILDGLQSRWTEPGEQRRLRLAGLGPGAYVLRVRTVGATGLSSSREATLAFEVLAPFWRRWWFYAGAGLMLTGALLALQRAHSARLVAIERTRTRIATDLHDEVGAGLSQIAVLSELIGRPELPEGRDAPAQIAATARRLVDQFSDLIWAINPERDRLANLAQRMRSFATAFARARGIEIAFESFDDRHDRPLDGETRRELLLLFQEAINNAVKHANCRRIEVRFSVQAGAIELRVADDGQGFDPEARDEGTGLPSLRRRAQRLGGRCAIVSAPGCGTTIILRAPPERRSRSRA